MFTSREPERTELQVLLVLLAVLSMGASSAVVAYAAVGTYKVLRRWQVANCERWRRGDG